MLQPNAIEDLFGFIEKPSSCKTQICYHNLKKHIILSKENIQKILLRFSEKLLSLNARNRLLNSTFTSYSESFLFIDEVPQQLASKLADGMKFIPLPPLEAEPPDEQNKVFMDALEELKLKDEDYLSELKKINDADDNDQDKVYELELKALRKLKNKLREQLGLPMLPSSNKDKSITNHAKIHDINPGYDLPNPDNINLVLSKYSDDKIQTLFLFEGLQARLNKLKQKYNHNLRETGLQTLYVCFGFLEWKEIKTSKKRLAPLILLPVEFSEDRNDFSIKSQDSELLDNKTLRLYLENEFKLELPEFPSIAEGESIINIEEYLKDVNALVIKEKGWRVLRRASVGIFYTQELAINEDLKQIAENPNDLLSDLLSGKSLESSDKIYDVDDPEFQQILPSLIEPADSSQHSAVIEMLQGNSFVLRGPPGTGKSQTICNMIAAGISEGKKILFIADKEAALEVVRSRLTSAGLSPYMLKAYSNKSSKKEFWDSIKSRLKKKTSTFRIGEYELTLAKLQSTKNQLNDYANFIGKIYGKSGKTHHEILWEQESLAEKYPVDSIGATLKDPTKISDIEIQSTQEAFSKIAKQFLPEFINHPWASSMSPPQTPQDLKEFSQSMTQWGNLVRGLDTKFLKIDQHSINYSKLLFLFELVCLINKVALELDDANNKALFDYINSDDITKESIASLCKEVSQFQGLEKYFLECLPGVQNIDQAIEVAKKLSVYLHHENIFLDINKIISNAGDWAKVFTSLDSFSDEIESVKVNDIKQFLEIKKLIIDFHNTVPEPLRLTDNFLSPVIFKKISLLKNVIHLKETLINEEIDIDNILASPEDIRKAALIINESNFLSIFDLDYWKANKLCKSVINKKLYSSEKVKLLSSLAAFLEEKTLISNDQDLINVFGISFNNEKTSSELVNGTTTLLERIWELNLESCLSPGLFSSIQKNLNSFINQFINLLPENLDFKFIQQEQWYKESVNIAGNLSTFSQNLQELTSLASEIEELKLGDLVLKDVLPLERKRLEYFKLRDSIISLTKENLPAVDVNKYLQDEFFLSLENLQKINNLISQNKLSVELKRAQFEELFSNITSLKSSYLRVIEELGEILDSVEADVFEISLDEISLEDINQFLNAHLKSEKSLDKFFRFRNLEKDLNQDYERNFYNSFAKNFPETRDNLFETFLSWLRQKQYQDILSDDVNKQIINFYRGESLTKLRRDLKKLDSEIQQLTREKVASLTQETAKQAPAGNHSNKVGEKTEKELLEYGITKKTFPRGSVREHILKTAESLTCFSPCWMLTPANVSTFLPLRDLFDIVIIDEASQMTPAKAFGAIGRSKQLVVVGDENQLPPTSFFQRSDSEIEEELDMDVDESILDLALGVWRNPRMLMWHYRSKHEDLIRFQNSFIYDSKLIIPPSTMGGDSKEYGVSNHFLEDSLYMEGGINDLEAEKILEIILEHVNRFPKKSLGIAVMNIKQTNLLREKVNRELSNNRNLADYIDYWSAEDDGLNRFFIKNLENVQGDERDVIIVGTVYGRQTIGGRVSQRFPTINSPTGHRRLNVITTRARDKVHVVSSIRSSDILEKNVLGKKFLAEYLDYSVSKKIVEGSESVGTPDSPFEEWAIDAIKSFGFEAVPQVGVRGFKIDIGVKHPDVAGYLLGVECDGATYHSSSSARDRDHLRQEILEAFGWNIHRIWSTDWIWDPIETKEKLRKALIRALEVSKKELNSA